MNRSSGLLALGVVVVGCGGPKGYVPTKVAEVPKTTFEAATPEDFIPLKEGNRWTYAMETIVAGKKTATENGELVFEVSKVTPKGDGKSAVVRVLRDDKEVDRQTWVQTSKGLYQSSGLVNGQDVAFTPPQPLALFPMKQGLEFEWKGKGVCPDGKPGSIRAKARVLDIIDVDTGLGRKSGIPIESNQDFQSSANKGGMAVTTWYAPKIGILRIKQTTVVPRGAITTTLRLTKAPA